MDADDEFGDLYTDVLVSSDAAVLPPRASPSPSPNPNFVATSVAYLQDDDDLYGVTNTKSNHSLGKRSSPPRIPDTSDLGEGRGSDGLRAPLIHGVFPLKLSGNDENEKPDDSGLNLDQREASEQIVQDSTGDFVDETKADDFSSLASHSFAGKVFPASRDPNATVRGGPNKDDAPSDGDWDSDSEDDLQIVLNVQTDHIGINLEGHQGLESGDEDGDDLVIVAGDGEQILPQVIEEREIGDESAQLPSESERKEGAEAAKVIGIGHGAAGGKVGYNNHGHYPHHSQFKYVRPGVASIPGTGSNAVGAPAQVRPFVNLATATGRGRGDWRPLTGKGPTSVQKGFHTGFGLSAWTNHSAGHGFGSGPEFTLPSHKTVFDIDIDAIEDKIWRHPGVDSSDYFNFGLDEDNWKSYCKQLEQLRLEATMQSKIRVYESGRSDQDYDPDLPPELAAAASHHEISTENPPGKTDSGQTDIIGQGRGSARIRPPIPTGRAIQVESGCGERLPSIDTRPPRYRDSDAIIEIVLQASGDDDPGEDANGRPENKQDGIDYGVEGQEVRNSKRSDVDPFGSSPQPYSGREQGIFIQDNLVGPLQGNVDGESFPHEASVQYRPGGGGCPFGMLGPSHGRRRSQGTAGGGDSEIHASPSGNSSPVENAEIKSVHSSEENSDGIHDLKQIKEVSSPQLDLPQTKGSLDVEESDNIAEKVVSSVSVYAEGEATLDLQIPNEASECGSSPVHSGRRQKLGSRIEQPVTQDLSEYLKTNKIGSSKAKRSNSLDLVKDREVGDEEVIHNGRASHTGDAKRHYREDEAGLEKRDDYSRGSSRYDMDRGRMSSKGREDVHYRSGNDPYLNRERDGVGNSFHHARGKNEGYDRMKDREMLAWQRREDDLHARRQREEDSRRRDWVEDSTAKLKSRGYESGRNNKEEHIQFQKRLEDGNLRVYHDKEGQRSRERDVLSMSHRSTIDNVHANRRKEVEHNKRDRFPKEDTMHAYYGGKDQHKQRDRADNLELRRRDDLARTRDKPDDQHINVRHRDGIRRQRDHDDHKNHDRVKPSADETHGNWERESRDFSRSRQAFEDQAWLGSSRIEMHSKDESRDSDKDHKRHRHEQSRSRDKLEEEQHRSRHDQYAHDNHLSSEDRSLRHEKFHSQNDNLGSTEKEKEKNKDSLRKLKEFEGNNREIQASSATDKHGKAAGGKRKLQESSIPQRHEKVSRKSTPIYEDSDGLQEQDATHQGPHSKSLKHSDEGGSDEENARKGRSKLERWMSRKDKNAVSVPTGKPERNHTPAVAHRSRKEDSKRTETAEKMQESAIPTVPTESVPNVSADVSQHDDPAHCDANGDDEKHLQTVAKLKKRSERFKQPIMPNEKEVSKKVDHEVSTQREASDVKPERPARKRRWVSN